MGNSPPSDRVRTNTISGSINNALISIEPNLFTKDSQCDRCHCVCSSQYGPGSSWPVWLAAVMELDWVDKSIPSVNE